MIQDRIQQTQEKFDNIQASINLIKEELEKHGFSTVNDLELELVKLQGEYRVLVDMKASDLDKKGTTVHEDVNVKVKVKGEE